MTATEVRAWLHGTRAPHSYQTADVAGSMHNMVARGQLEVIESGRQQRSHSPIHSLVYGLTELGERFYLADCDRRAEEAKAEAARKAAKDRNNG